MKEGEDRAGPCPSCGGRATVERRKGFGKAGAAFYRETVTCSDCALHIFAKRPGAALAIWNRK